MDRAVIRIRYRDFSSGTHHVTGFHGKAELCAHGVTVYLLPGMTRWQRKAVLRRLRMEASRGYGPALPLPQLALALAVDHVRTALRITAGAVRLHPSQTLLPSAGAVLLMAFFVLASAGGRMQFAPRAGLDGLVSGGGKATVAAAAPFDLVGVNPARRGPVTGRENTGAAAEPGSGHAAPASQSRRSPGPRVERACFGAMPGFGSAHAAQLACRATIAG
jgi:hypothetical protein